MRKLLFRGICVYADSLTGENNFVHGSNLYDLGNGKMSVNDIEVLASTVSQYIGLNDCNETPIFEGDIVKYSVIENPSRDCDDEPFINEYIDKVIYNENEVKYQISYFGRNLAPSDGTDKFEVVGNIFTKNNYEELPIGCAYTEKEYLEKYPNSMIKNKFGDWRWNLNSLTDNKDKE